jgi:Domain of unknown function (DUF6089)
MRLNNISMRFKFALIACLLSLSVSAQRHVRQDYWEAGIMFGGTNYSGDVSEKRVSINETQVAYGAFVRYHVNPKLAFKLHAYSGSISGDDKNNPSTKVRSYRFGASIFETAVMAEWSPFGKPIFTNTGIHRLHIDPYVFAGFGFTFADAKAEYYGPDSLKNNNLRVPLPETGLNERLPLAPVGAGIRVAASDWLMIGGEFGVRPVFSDDIDGMRINGNPNSNDWYYFGGVTLSVVLGGARYR